MEESALRLVGAPLVAGLLLVGAGLVAAATAATRLRFFFGRGRPASLAPEIPAGASGGSPAGDAIKEILRQGGLTYPEPQGAVEGLLYHWAPTLITAPREVQLLARRYMFNLRGDRGDAGQLPVLVVRVRQRRDAAVDRASSTSSSALVFLIRPVLAQHKAQVTTRLARRPGRRGDPRRRWRSAWSPPSCRRSARSRSTPRPSSCSAPRSSPARWRWSRSWRRSTPRRRRAPASSRSGCR